MRYHAYTTALDLVCANYMRLCPGAASHRFVNRKRRHNKHINSDGPRCGSRRRPRHNEHINSGGPRCGSRRCPRPRKSAGTSCQTSFLSQATTTNARRPAGVGMPRVVSRRVVGRGGSGVVDPERQHGRGPIVVLPQRQHGRCACELHRQGPVQCHADHSSAGPESSERRHCGSLGQIIHERKISAVHEAG